jgi:DNA-binding GntR family transcriptional regulator
MACASRPCSHKRVTDAIAAQDAGAAFRRMLRHVRVPRRVAVDAEVAQPAG